MLGLEKEYYKAIYSFELEERKRILERIKQDNKKLVEEISSEIIKLLDSKIYDEYFWNTVKEVLSSVDASKSRIGLVKKDFDRYKNRLSEEYFIECVQIDDKFIGGVIVENENILIDSTLKNAIEEEIRKKNLG